MAAGVAAFVLLRPGAGAHFDAAAGGAWLPFISEGACVGGEYPSMCGLGPVREFDVDGE